MLQQAQSWWRAWRERRRSQAAERALRRRTDYHGALDGASIETRADMKSDRVHIREPGAGGGGGGL
jgi:hypothetical protein